MIDPGSQIGRRQDRCIRLKSRYPSKIREAYEEVGADRIMFGTDAPYHPAAVEAMKVMTSGLTEEQIKDVFYNNCAKLMGFDKK